MTCSQSVATGEHASKLMTEMISRGEAAVFHLCVHLHVCLLSTEHVRHILPQGEFQLLSVAPRLQMRSNETVHKS